MNNKDCWIDSYKLNLSITGSLLLDIPMINLFISSLKFNSKFFSMISLFLWINIEIYLLLPKALGISLNSYIWLSLTEIIISLTRKSFSSAEEFS